MSSTQRNHTRGFVQPATPLHCYAHNDPLPRENRLIPGCRKKKIPRLGARTFIRRDNIPPTAMEYIFVGLHPRFDSCEAYPDRCVIVYCILGH